MTASDHAPSNLLRNLPDASAGEVFHQILGRRGCRIERIVSYGHTTPVDEPYRQAHQEWVLVLAGRARLDVEGRSCDLRPGDHLLIPANAEHRVTFTDPDGPTVWLAVHLDEREAD